MEGEQRDDLSTQHPAERGQTVECWYQGAELAVLRARSI